jgi:hypothetical protein
MQAAVRTHLHPLGKGLACILWMPAQPERELVLSAAPQQPIGLPKLLPFGGTPGRFAGRQATCSTTGARFQACRANMRQFPGRHPSKTLIATIADRSMAFALLMGSFAKFNFPS